jgi:hypothetical protein
LSHRQHSSTTIDIYCHKMSQHCFVYLHSIPDNAMLSNSPKYVLRGSIDRKNPCTVRNHVPQETLYRKTHVPQNPCTAKNHVLHEAIRIRLQRSNQRLPEAYYPYNLYSSPQSQNHNSSQLHHRHQQAPKSLDNTLPQYPKPP